MTPVVNPRAGAAGGRYPRRLAAASFGLVILVTIEYVLGISYNLYGTAPTATRKVALFSSPLLAVHVAVGTLLVLAAIYLVVVAVRARLRPVVITSVIGLLAVIAAWVSGSAFVEKGQNGFSMAMAVLTGVALLCYAANVRVLAGHRHE
jgi:hypothetical protein